jgi:predicted nucleotidyltransferase
MMEWKARHEGLPGLRRRDIEMRKQAILRLLAEHKKTLSRRFGVTDLALFGSAARDTATADSDIDILVSFDGPATSARYFGVQFYLEDLLGRPVDLVTDKALRPELRPYIISNGRQSMSEEGKSDRQGGSLSGEGMGG